MKEGNKRDARPKSTYIENFFQRLFFYFYIIMKLCNNIVYTKLLKHMSRFSKQFCIIDKYLKLYLYHLVRLHK